MTRCSRIGLSPSKSGRRRTSPNTWAARPPRAALLAELGLRPRQEEGWRSLFARAGFTELSCEVRRISLGEQLAGHLQVDGLWGYLSAAARGLASLRIRRAFLNRRMLRAALRFLPYLGYGLYAARRDA